MNRCVNIDWLEVYCLEPQTMLGEPIITAEYLRGLGFLVKARDYGTPTYEEMLFVTHPEYPEEPFMEVRRKPRPSSSDTYFMHKASAHLRMTNRFCYHPTPVAKMAEFIVCCGYFFQSIKRIDICLDFNYFDSGENPADVLRAFITEKLSKINQTKVSAYGEDLWDGRSWNSIRWGSPSSNIATRFYCKSLELQQVKMKTYIQDCWKLSGINIEKPVWRVEFQVKAGSKGFKNKETQDFYKMKLSTFDTKGKLMFIFHSLCSKYFHFKYREQAKDGSWKRKDRCRDKKLFEISWNEELFTPALIKNGRDPTRMERILMKKCFQMQDETWLDESVKDAALVLAQFYESKFYGYIS